jgi:peptidyl-prolyl cis-trans isomerase C
MKPTVFLAFICTFAAWAQQPSPTLAAAPWTKLPDAEVIATVDGVPLTMGQFKTFTGFLDPSAQAKLALDPGELVRELALMRKLSAVAVEQKLDQTSPVKEQLEYNRLVMLSQAAASYLVNSPTVVQEDIAAYYAAHKDSYKQVKVQAIYISFSLTPGAQAGGKKTLSEAEAKAKAAKLLTAIKGGADFVKLVHENSEDETSKARDGDFATVTPSDNIPDALRIAVFGLKEGETSEPVRQANGFYLLRAQQVTYQPLAKVQDQVYTTIKTQRGAGVLDKMHRELNIQFPNPAFPGKTAAPGGNSK